MKTELSENEMINKIKVLCSRKEMCISDVRNKLKEWHLIPSKIDEIIQNLVQEQFIDEVRYAKSFVNDKSQLKSWGKRKILYFLEQKHIDKDAILQAINAIDADDYSEELQEVIQKKHKLLAKRITEKKVLRQKVVQFCISKGYSYEDITKAMRKIETTEEEDEI